MGDTFSWKTSDGLAIYAIDWPVNEAKAVIALVHGLGEHAHRYEHLVRFFHQHQIAVIAYDRRGHGQSAGRKGHTPKYGAFLEEIDQLLVETKKRYAELPVFLYGHSMGGNLVLTYALQYQPAIQGVIATAAHIRLGFEPSAFTLMLGRLMRNIFPAFTQSNGLDVQLISKDPVVVEAYTQDPLVHDRITAATGLAMLEAAADLDAYQGDFPVPLLLMHGGADGITAPAGTQALAQRLSSDVELKIWDGLYHEIHNETEQTEVFSYTLNWIEQLLKG